MGAPAKIAVVITAWNQLALTNECLVSVAAQVGVETTVILVDNGSEPPLAPLLAPQPAGMVILRQPINRGFAGGYNIGLNYALAHGFEQICLLNNDVVLAPDCLAQLAAAASAAVGLVSAAIFLKQAPDRLWSSGQSFHPWLLETRSPGEATKAATLPETVADRDFFPLCVVLLAQAALTDVGLLDEAYFVYYEDLDYCQRLAQRGWRRCLAPAARAWHAVAASSGGQDTPFARYWSAQASGRYFRRHGGWRLLLIIPYRLGSALRLTGRFLRQRRGRALAAYWLGLSRGWLTGRADAPPPDWVN